MNTVEDALELIAGLNGLPIPFSSTDAHTPWKIRFLSNVTKYVAKSKPLSVAQSRIVLKMLAEDAEELVEEELCTQLQIDRLLSTPRYRLTPFVSQNIVREVRYVGENYLAFRFKMDELIVADIKNLSSNGRPTVSRSWFDGEHRVWMVPVLHSSLDNIKQLIAKYQFDFDDPVVEYLTEATNSLNREAMFILAEHSNTIAAYVPDNDIIAWWTLNILEGEVV